MLSGSPGDANLAINYEYLNQWDVGRDKNFKLLKIFEIHNSAVGYFEGALAGWKSGLQLRLLKYF